MAIRPDPAVMSKAFLRYALEAAGVSRVISGSAQPQITRVGLSGVRCPVPDLEEQRRIVEVLTAIDDYASAAEAVVERNQALRRAVAARLLSGADAIPDSYDFLLETT